MVLKLGHFESRSEIPGNFSYVLLEKAGDDHLDRSCEMRRVKGERNSLYTVKRVKVNWIGHFWRRNCRLKRVIVGTKKKM
jgi:hypothetical protein